MTVHQLPKLYHPDFSNPRKKPVQRYELDPTFKYRKNIVACWVFDKVNGTMRDLSGNGYDVLSGNNSGGTFTPSASTGPAPIVNATGKAADFDGAEDCFEISSSLTTTDRMQKITSYLFAGVFDDTGDGDQRVIDKSNSGGGSNGWFLDVNEVAGRIFVRRRNSSNANETLRVNNAYVAGEYNTFCATTPVDGVSAKAELYRNGQDLRGIATFGTDDTFTDFITTSTGARIGTWNHASARELSGSLSLLVLFDDIQIPSATAQKITAEPWRTLFRPAVMPVYFTSDAAPPVGGDFVFVRPQRLVRHSGQYRHG